MGVHLAVVEKSVRLFWRQMVRDVRCRVCVTCLRHDGPAPLASRDRLRWGGKLRSQNGHKRAATSSGKTVRRNPRSGWPASLSKARRMRPSASFASRRNRLRQFRPTTTFPMSPINRGAANARRRPQDLRIVFIGKPADGQMLIEAARNTGTTITVVDRAIAPPMQPLEQREQRNEPTLGGRTL